jgi:uncharacterized membrane protein
MPDSSLEQMVAESQAEQDRRPVLGAVHLLLPLAVLATAIAALYFTGNLRRFSLASAASFFTLGKFIIVFGGLPAETYDRLGMEKMSTAELAGMVVFMDVLYAYFLAFNLHHVYRIRRFGIGPAIQRLQNFCQWWLSERPWMRRWAFTGVMLFVMFPLTGTGAPGGSIIGRLVGLRARTTLAAITIGSLLGSTIMAVLADRLEPLFEQIQDEWWFHSLGIVIIAVVIALLYWLGRRLSRAADDYARRQGDGGTP